MTSTPGGVHVATSSRPCLELFELTGNLTVHQSGGVDDDAFSVTAKPIHYNRGSNDYAGRDDLAEVTLYDVLARHDGSNNSLGPPPLAEGDRTWAYFNSQSGRWELLRYPLTLARFELDATLATGGGAAATAVLWNGTDWTASGTSLVVYDSLEMFASAAGGRGVAAFFPDAGRWEILQLENDPSASPICLDVLTGVSKVGCDLVFTRKQICLPTGSTSTDLASLTIEDCCCGDSS
jgi:hypothetical protein